MDLPDDEIPELPPSRLPRVLGAMAVASALVISAIAYRMTDSVNEELAKSAKDLAGLHEAGSRAGASADMAPEADLEKLRQDIAELKKEAAEKFVRLQEEENENDRALAGRDEPAAPDGPAPRPPDTLDGSPLVEK